MPRHQCHVIMYRINRYPTLALLPCAHTITHGGSNMLEWVVNAMGLGLVLGEGWNDLVLGPSQGVFTQLARVLPDTHQVGHQGPWIQGFCLCCKPLPWVMGPNLLPTMHPRPHGRQWAPLGSPPIHTTPSTTLAQPHSPPPTYPLWEVVRVPTHHPLQPTLTTTTEP